MMKHVGIAKLRFDLKIFLAGVVALAASPAYADSVVPILPKISVGFEHVLLLKTDGTVWSWGRDQWGQLGLGPQGGTTATPKGIATLSGVVSVVARESFSMALKADGTVWTWGENSNGRIGPYNGRSNVPVQVTGLSSILGIDAGWGFTAYAINSIGSVYAWGRNTNGEFGTGSATPASSTTPQLIQGLSGIFDVRAADTSALALRQDGKVFQWASIDQPSPISEVAGVTDAAAIGADGINNTNANFAVLSTGEVMSWGDTNSGVTRCGQPKQSGVTVFPAAKLSGFANIISVSSGPAGADVFLDSAGQAWTCGGGSGGEQGDGTTRGTETGTKVGPIRVSQTIPFVNAAMGKNGAAIGEDGSVWTWGFETNGIQGDGNLNAFGVNPTPKKITINAGNPGAVQPVFAGTQSTAGAGGTTSLDVGVMFAYEHWSMTGKAYVAALFPGGQLYVLSPSGWAPYIGGEIPAWYTGQLQGMLPVSLGTDNFSALSGVQILVGYGLGSGVAADNDLLGAGRYKSVLTLR